jgi:hypothetical protein
LLLEAGADPFLVDGSPVEGSLSAHRWVKANGWDEILELMAKTALAREGQILGPIYQPHWVAYALEVQKRAVQEMQESSTGKQILGSSPLSISEIISKRFDFDIER